MTGFLPRRTFPSLLLCITAILLPAYAQTTLKPAIVVAGSPELIRVSGHYLHVEGSWLGRKILFFPARDGSAWYALAGVDVEAKPGPSTLTLTATEGTIVGLVPRDLSLQIPIRPAHYRTAALTVAPGFVEPDPAQQAEIALATKAKEAAFAQGSSKPLWSGSFTPPVPSQPTDSFGTRRTLNGKLSTIHKGMDFRAPVGTPVTAGNSGRVLLAQKLYYEGNCVILDHGQGLMTIHMHLSRIDVHPGDTVTQGQQLGLSGATGRVTGPHLHWAVRWQAAMLDPAKLLALNLSHLP